MAEFFTHNAPDYGEEDTLLGPPWDVDGGQVSPHGSGDEPAGQNLFARPVAHALPLGWPDGRNRWEDRRAREKCRRDGSALAGQYVGPNDMRAHKLIPRYIPRQDWQNSVRQDQLSDWFGPMQKPA